ncbi:MAG TPA: alcohol dehydrogenase catalytic domain-containing protein [Longimicrobiales bacterium]|nr:alcohol dehydrogenase catalytic domain-containing protein [Longimicrobiales bacterium]
MLSAQLVEPLRFQVREVADPEPGPGQVTVRVEGCGVCGSNLPPWRGAPGTRFPLEPGAPGHEAWGVVVAAGPGAEDLLGRRVAMLSYNGFAELDRVGRERVVPLAPELDGRDVPGEPLACAVNVAKRAGVAWGDTVVVIGIGFLGALLIPLLRESRPRSIVAVSRRRSALEIAERMGADETLTLEEAARWAGGAPDGAADVVVEATGEQAPLDLAARLCRVHARLVVAGYHQDGPRRVDLQLWNWRGIDVINAHERDPRAYVEGMRSGLRRMAEGRLDPSPLVTHRLPLREIQRAFEAADRRDAGFFKAMVVADGSA